MYLELRYFLQSHIFEAQLIMGLEHSYKPYSRMCFTNLQYLVNSKVVWKHLGKLVSIGERSYILYQISLHHTSKHL